VSRNSQRQSRREGRVERTIGTMRDSKRECGVRRAFTHSTVGFRWPKSRLKSLLKIWTISFLACTQQNTGRQKGIRDQRSADATETVAICTQPTACAMPSCHTRLDNDWRPSAMHTDTHTHRGPHTTTYVGRWGQVDRVGGRKGGGWHGVVRCGMGWFWPHLKLDEFKFLDHQQDEFVLVRRICDLSEVIRVRLRPCGRRKRGGRGR
jgi:hypothetical protein